MTSDRHIIISEVFLAAREMPVDQQTVFLEDACGDDAAMRSEIEKMLDHDRRGGMLDEDAGSELHRVADEVLATPSSRPGRISRYEILGVLGEGGMGTVYEARQQNPNRVVALKVIKPGMSSARLVRRFEHEAQLLGRLQHPGIAQIFEAGTEDTGQGPQPFFAMELVKGLPLSKYVADKQLEVHGRLELMARVCDAVHHAHMNGIIHRDLKPGNILVTDADTAIVDRMSSSTSHSRYTVGQPKVLDFGIARATDSDIRTTTLQTDVGQLIGTIPYMSPEQVAGDPTDVDVRSDVYALGVIAYELLSGKLPYDLERKQIPEAARIIQDEEPSQLSSVNRSLRGDVETIVLKALEKDKTRRYQSASDLAADLRRFLRNEPIVARPPSAAYQLRKLVARHKLPFICVALLFLAVTVFAIVAGVQAYQLSESNAQLANSNAQKESARQSADREAKRAQAARQVADREAERARIEARKASRVTKFLQDMLSAVDPKALGKEVTVRTVLEQAAERVSEELADEPEVEASVRHTIGTTLFALGDPLVAEPHLRAALATRQERLGPDNKDTIGTRVELALVLRENGNLPEAEALGREALEAYRRTIGADHPDVFSAMNTLALICQAKGEFNEAEDLFRDSLAFAERLGEAGKDKVTTALNNLAGCLLVTSRPKEAEPVFRRVLGLLRENKGQEHPDVLMAMHNLADSLRQMQEFKEGRALLLETMELRTRVLGPEHTDTLATMNSLAGMQRLLGNLEESETIYRKILTVQREKLGDDSLDTLATMNNLAGLLTTRLRHEEAEVIYREALESARRVLGNKHPSTLSVISNLANVCKYLKKIDEAEVLLQEVTQTVEDLFGKEHPASLTVGFNYATLVWMQQRLDESEVLLRDLIIRAKKVLPEGHWNIGAFQLGHGACLIEMKRFADAEGVLLEGYQILLKTFGPDHWRTHDALQNLCNLYKAWEKPDKQAEYRKLLPEDYDPTRSVKK